MEPVAQGAYRSLNAFIQFAYNELLRRLALEKGFDIVTVPGTRGHDPTTDLYELFGHALEGKLVQPGDGITDLHVQDAFRSFTSSATVELALVASTVSLHSNLVSQMALSIGTESRVSIPPLGLKMMKHRLDRGDSFAVQFLHTHPSGFMHALFDLSQLGPSSTDRFVVMKEIARAFVHGRRVLPQFILVEDNEFRRFVFPPWEVVFGVLAAIWKAWHERR